MDFKEFSTQYKNFIFIGEAGSGKSEISLNIVKKIAQNTETNVHFFDMDMTKPLFRSRDLSNEVIHDNIIFHYEEQFMDAPTMVGGVRQYLLDANSKVVMDVGGSDIGARAIGGFSHIINRDDTAIYYVVNPYRPWSDTIEHIDGLLGEILNVSHVELKKLKVISNPNIGKETSIQDVLKGHDKLKDMIGKYLPIEFLVVDESMSDDFCNTSDISVILIQRFLKYPWEL